MAKRRVEIGPVGYTVRTQVAAVRKRRKLTLRDLSERLAEIERPMGHSTLSEIEHGARRVDVDDLVALATALDVPVVELLGIELPRWATVPVSDAAMQVIQTIVDADQKGSSHGNN